MPQDVDITLIILVAIVAGIPILGITFRMAIKPIVEALLVLQESFSEASLPDGVDLRLARLEEEIRVLSRALEGEKEEGSSPPR